MAGCVLQVADNLFLSMCTVRQAKRLMIASSESKILMAGIKENDGTVFRPSSLADILQFTQHVRAKLLSRVGNSVIMICVGRHPEAFSKTALALGAYLIMYQQHSFQAVENIFNPLLQEYVDSLRSDETCGMRENVSVKDCWLALFHARFNSVLNAFALTVNFKLRWLNQTRWMDQHRQTMYQELR